jgi:hypothetical protein
MRLIRGWNAGAVLYQRPAKIITGLLFAGVVPLCAETPQNSNSKQSDASPTAMAKAITTVGSAQRTTAEIMADPRNSTPRDMIILNWEMEQPDRSNLPSRPGALEGAQWPLPNGEPNSSAQAQTAKPYAPQTLGIQFDGATGPTETGIPPDTMGAVGPTQFFVFLTTLMKSSFIWDVRLTQAFSARHKKTIPQLQVQSLDSDTQTITFHLCRCLLRLSKRSTQARW